LEVFAIAVRKDLSNQLASSADVEANGRFRMFDGLRPAGDAVRTYIIYAAAQRELLLVNRRPQARTGIDGPTRRLNLVTLVPTCAQ